MTYDNEITSGEFDRRVAARKKELSSQTTLNLHSIWNRGDVLKSQALHEIRAQIEKEMSFLPFEDFRKRELPRILSELQLDPAELGIELPPTSTA